MITEASQMLLQKGWDESLWWNHSPMVKKDNRTVESKVIAPLDPSLEEMEPFVDVGSVFKAPLSRSPCFDDTKSLNDGWDQGYPREPARGL
jgi:hypothetical protein